MANLNDFIKNSERMTNVAKKAYANVLNNTSDEHIDNIQNGTPVDTGELRDSFEGEVNGDTIKTSTDCEHYIFVEENHISRGGTLVKGSHMVEKANRKLDKVIEKEVDKFFDELDKMW